METRAMVGMGQASGRRVLTVNAGSSSVRLGLFAAGAQGAAAEAQAHYESGKEAPRTLLGAFLATHGEPVPACVAHRVVHGGTRLTAPCLIDETVEHEIDRLVPWAPLHNPVALAWIRVCREVFGPEVAQVAVFDTGFYAGLPPAARSYALPHALAERHGIQRYGFHGLAHQAMWRRWCELGAGREDAGRVISFQLGAGCSVTAVAGGRARDTSMGFSPLEGLVMATRSGDVDAGAVIYLQRAAELTREQIEQLLNEQSGLLGVSGVSGDMRTLLASNEPRARLAIELYCLRARKYLGAYLAVLGGVDAVLFGGGVGENAPAIRAQIVGDMEWAGIALDAARNDTGVGREARISADASRVEVWVIPVEEERVLAEAALSLLAHPPRQGRGGGGR